MKTVKIDELKDAMISSLEQLNIDENSSTDIANCLIESDLYGVTSHGTKMFIKHYKKFEEGSYNIKPDFKILKETNSFALIDGDNACGITSACNCMRFAIKKAKQEGIFTVISRNNNTFGPAFYYSLLAAKEGLIGFCMSNSPANMMLPNGKEKMLGTNPFSIAIPNGDDFCIIDMASSSMAKSKVLDYLNSNTELPDGVGVDKEGEPTTDPKKVLDGGAVTPMSGFKGVGIAMIIDILSGLLSGAAFLNNVGQFYSTSSKNMNVGFYFVAIDPSIIYGENYKDVLKKYFVDARSSKHKENKEIILPGDDRLKYRNNLCNDLLIEDYLYMSIFK